MMKACQQKDVKTWSDALGEAQQKLAEGKRFVSQMRNVVRLIERKIADGEEFPRKKAS